MHIPLQAPPVIRSSIAVREWRDAGCEDAPAAQLGAGVEASQSPCENVTGPAKSLCYALRYGISM
jgi:hypothetical protein